MDKAIKDYVLKKIPPDLILSTIKHSQDTLKIV